MYWVNTARLEAFPGLVPYLPPDSRYRSDSADAVNFKLPIDKPNDSSAVVGPTDGGEDSEAPSYTRTRRGPWPSFNGDLP